MEKNKCDLWITILLIIIILIGCIGAVIAFAYTPQYKEISSTESKKIIKSIKKTSPTFEPAKSINNDTPTPKK